jgi:hypothetical protein
LADGNINYRLKKVNSLEIEIKALEAINVTVSGDFEKWSPNHPGGVRAGSAPDPAKEQFLSPARLITWNDATAKLTDHRNNVVIPSATMRSVSVRFNRVVNMLSGVKDEIKVTGTIVEIGESKVSLAPDNWFHLELGYGIKGSGVFSNRTMLNVGPIKMRETLDGSRRQPRCRGKSSTE